MLNGIVQQKTEGMIDRKDIEEMTIRNIVKDTMKELPLRMEEFILAYQLIHAKDENYNEKIGLLNDMVTYSKIKFLEQKGLYKVVEPKEKEEMEQE